MEPLTPSSADELAALDIAALGIGDRLTAGRWRRLLSGNTRAWGIRRNGVLVAAVLVLLRRGSASARIHSLMVDPGWRRKGLASTLIQGMELPGIDAIHLEVREDNRGARALYHRLGFRVLARIAGYYGPGADALRCSVPWPINASLDRRDNRLMAASRRKAAERSGQGSLQTRTTGRRDRV